MIQLAQKKPGDWFLFSDFVDPIPVPSWLIEAFPNEDDRRDLAHTVARIYGQGRIYGREEGRDQVRKDLLNVMGIDLDKIKAALKV